MTITELRALIANLPDDMPVILQKDAEGNGYSPLDGGDHAMYSADSTWSGEVYPTTEQIAEPGSGYDQDDEAPDDATRVFVLWPVN